MYYEDLASLLIVKCSYEVARGYKFLGDVWNSGNDYFLKCFLFKNILK